MEHEKCSRQRIVLLKAHTPKTLSRERKKSLGNFQKSDASNVISCAAAKEKKRKSPEEMACGNCMTNGQFDADVYNLTVVNDLTVDGKATFAGGVVIDTGSVMFADSTVQTTSASAANINATLVYASADQALPASAGTQLSYDTVYSSHSSPNNVGSPMYNPSAPTILTIPQAGYYIIVCGTSVTPPATTGGQIALQLWKSGTVLAQQSQELTSTADNTSYNASSLISCVAGDTIYVTVSNGNTNALSAFGGNDPSYGLSYLSVALLAGGS